MSGFTPEMRQKSMEVRKRNAEQRRLLKQNALTGTATTSIRAGETGEAPAPVIPPPPVAEYNPLIHDNAYWNNAPLPIAIASLNEMKRDLDRASQIILMRQSKLPTVWVCWSRENKSKVPVSIYRQCKGPIPDGRWVFRDDGAKDDQGNPHPAVCCSQLCYMAYTQYRALLRQQAAQRTR
jgi:hypothetical protein